jgi:hypothetical protein
LYLIWSLFGPSKLVLIDVFALDECSLFIFASYLFVGL